MREVIYYDKIQRLRLFDDVFMSEAFKDVACVELMLKVILGRDDVHVLSVKTQKILQGWGRTLRLDVWGIEERGQFNTEIQRTNDGADRKRARLHSSTLDYFSLEAGQKFRDRYRKLIKSYKSALMFLSSFTASAFADIAG